MNVLCSCAKIEAPVTNILRNYAYFEVESSEHMRLLFITDWLLKLMNLQNKIDNFLNMYEYAMNLWSSNTWYCTPKPFSVAFMYASCIFWTSYIYIFSRLVQGWEWGASTLASWSLKDTLKSFGPKDAWTQTNQYFHTCRSTSVPRFDLECNYGIGICYGRGYQNLSGSYDKTRAERRNITAVRRIHQW